MLIKRYLGDTYPLVIKVEVNREPLDFTTVASMDLKFSVDDTIKTISSTVFDNVEGTVTFDVSTNSTIFDAVGVFDVALIGTDTSGFITTYDVGKLEILAVL